MSRTKPILAVILMVLSLGFLMGGDCDIEIEGFPAVRWVEPYYYDYVIIEEPVYYYDYWWW
ncbi:MAG TPA: hypothetical protein PKG54_16400 [Phycisphaerae bacterium]|jgi:hypothetical protein|nr:hypothetical protein [Phycisphaerae bacterium]HOB76097.1 hypothetical protein [Phycisphaerae bacterium]HOJ56046.1 hypothetical protein [Phycisphaerae bacterium]HOL27085.1 hypothetical protein [Phycisphaerae bacterium]HPP21217.1 hypothetical protein [Phycisphaerae bacterium]